MSLEAGREVLSQLHAVVDLVRSALDKLDDWGPTGKRPSQFRCDLAADEVAVEYLLGAGFAVWSEESGRQGSGPLLAVVDPVDGSTNAAAGIPFYATSIALVDSSGPLAALVANLVTDVRYEAYRGHGAYRSGQELGHRSLPGLSGAMVGLNGWPGRHLGWRKYRVMGSASLELCLVASGALDAFVDMTRSGLAPWDYMGAMLICQESGAVLADAHGRSLLCEEEGCRRAVVAAGGEALLTELVEARNAAVP